MEDKILTLNQPVEITGDQIAGLLCTAFEGGIYYWGRWDFTESYNPSEKDAQDEKYGDWSGFPQYQVTNPDFKLKVFDVEDEGEYLLDLTLLKNGMKTMSEKYPRHFRDFMSDNADAITGDVYLQCCIFGDVIYG